jgi:hypothetical protein
MIPRRQAIALVLSLTLLVTAPSVNLADTWIATDSADDCGLSTTVFSGEDIPSAGKYSWFSADPGRHDMWLLDKPGDLRDEVLERHIRWSKAAVQAFNTDYAINLVHEIRVNRDLYDAETYVSTDFPFSYEVEKENFIEEVDQGEEELEIKTLYPEAITPNADYQIRTHWRQLKSGRGTFSSETELTKEGVCDFRPPFCHDEWYPVGTRELGQMNFDTSLPNDAPKQWDFNSTGNFEGWTAHNIATSGAAVHSGILFMDPAGHDPYVQGPQISASASTYRFVEFKMASNAEDGNAYIYFKRQTDSDYAESRKVPFTAKHCSSSNACYGHAPFENYSVDMKTHPDWNGTITGIRIDPADNGRSGTNADSIGFDYIILASRQNAFPCETLSGAADVDPITPFTIAPYAAPNPSLVGDTVDLTSIVTRVGSAISGITAEVELFNSSNNRVFHKVFNTTTFASNETKIFTAAWKPTATGRYRLKVKVSNSSGSINYSLDEPQTVDVSGTAASPSPTPTPTPTPTPSPSTYVFRGRITDINGFGMGGVAIAYGTSGAASKTVITDSTGNYNINNIAGGLSYDLKPTKQNYYFIPRSARVENVSGDRTVNFTARLSPSPAPAIATEDDSARAASLDAVTLLRDPFVHEGAWNPLNPGGIPLITILVANLDLPLGETSVDGDITVVAQDSQLVSYPVTVEYRGKVPGMSWLTQLTLKIPQDSSLSGDLWLRVNFMGSLSNWARVTIALRPLQNMTFLEGDPKSYADGIVIDANGGTNPAAFEPRSPLRLSGVSNGLTFTFWVPPGSTPVHSLSFNVVSEKDGTPCSISFGAGGGFAAEVPGYNYRYVNIPQENLESFVTGANAFKPGCNFTIHDTYIKGLYLYPDNTCGSNITILDGAMLGLGQNKYPLVSRP